MNKAEQTHIEQVKSLPCALCAEPPPSDAHHIREGQGAAQRAGHFLTIPLCKYCHQGPQGVHGDKTMLRIYKTTELNLLDQTIGMLKR